MRKVLFISMAVIMIANITALAAAPIIAIVETTKPNVLEIVGTVTAGIVGIWEIVGRIIPSVNHITLLGKTINFLKKVSDFLNNNGKKNV